MSYDKPKVYIHTHPLKVNFTIEQQDTKATSLGFTTINLDYNQTGLAN